MDKEIKLKISFKTEFDLVITADLEAWNEADEESRKLYIKNKLEEDIDYFIDDIFHNFKFKQIEEE